VIRWLTSIRLTRMQLGAVAATSALVTALVIVDGTPGRTNLQAELAAARASQTMIIHHLGDGPPGSSPTASTTAISSSAAPAPSGAAAPVVDSAAAAPAANPTPTSTPATGTPQAAAPSPASAHTKVKHVFMIALSTTSYAAAFGRGSVATYLDHTLVPRGTLLTNYRTLGGSELSDYIAMVSGQQPNTDTTQNCTSYSEFPGGAKPDAAGLVPGDGCIYPVTALTLGDQVTGSGHVWKAYVDGLGSTSCVHPNSGALDDAPLPDAGPEYDTRHNPFIYFHSLLDLGDCASDDEALSKLGADLRSPSRTPTFAYLAPGLCDDSSQTSCPNGDPGGLAAEDGFLKEWVPKIMRSEAYRHAGALIIVFTISKPAGSTSVSEAASLRSARAGALVLSPFATAGRRVSRRYSPYSVLRSVEQLLGFTPLGEAKSATSFVAAALPKA
jgi:phosphatidylinositol-3-phosphatase